MQDTLDYLYSLHTRGIKPGLDRMNAFLAEIGRPERQFKSVHIAGTNGKGTVSQLIYAVLRASGKSAGLYTSPHLRRFNERIVVNDAEIPDTVIAAFVEQYRPLFDKFELTFFEITTAMAFQYFKDKKIEIAVLETGMGGRLDATNTVLPAVSAITDISLDHEQFLGKTLKEIAGEKAGIIKPGAPVLFGVSDSDARQVVEEKAAGITDYRDVLETFEFHVLEETAQDTLFNVKTDKWTFENLYMPLPGRHQIHNAMIALGVLERLYPDLSEEHIREGFKNVKLKGRIEFLKGPPDIVLDVAHNPRKISALNDYLIRFFPKKKMVIVFGAMADKDTGEMVRLLQRDKREFVFTRPVTDRAQDPLALQKTSGIGTVVPSVAAAVGKAKEMAGKRGLVVVTGSFFTVGEAMDALKP